MQLEQGHSVTNALSDYKGKSKIGSNVRQRESQVGDETYLQAKDPQAAAQERDSGDWVPLKRLLRNEHTVQKRDRVTVPLSS